MKTDSHRIVALRAQGWQTIAERARDEGVSIGTLRRWVLRGERKEVQRIGGMLLFPPRAAE